MPSCYTSNDQHQRLTVSVSALLFCILSHVVLILSFGSGTAFAKVSPPPGLEGWAPWVSEDLDHLQCAQRSSGHYCVWMSDLEIEVRGQSATLSYTVQMGKRGLAPLLDDHRLSIGEVNLIHDDGQPEPQVVIWRDKRAWVELAKGLHHLRASVTWDEQINSIKIPRDVARVKLSDQAGERSWVERDQEGAVWLKDRATRADSVNKERKTHPEATAKIFRVWRDEIPLKVETHLHLNISGKPREIVFGQLLPAGAIATDLESELDVDWVRDGLRVYVRPGKATIKLKAVFPNPVTTLSVPKVTGGEVAPQEVWVWHSQELLRSVKLSGLNEVDPDFTALPGKLRGGTHTWLASAGEKLVIEELKRGVSRRPSNKLRLERSLWLDLDGSGYSARDKIHGELRASSRLNVLSKGTLGRASMSSDGQTIPLLITQDHPVSQRNGKGLNSSADTPGLEGLELRVERLDLEADFRYSEHKADIPALDWSESMESLMVKLNLPPGWKLFTVSGADLCPDDWLTSWAMIDVFLVALITIGAYKLFGLFWSIIALLCLVLFHGDADFHLEWLSLIVGYFLLSNALANRLFMKLILVGFSFVTLQFVVLTLDLCKTDIRVAIHPQVDKENLAGFSYDSHHMNRKPSKSISRMSEVHINDVRGSWKKSKYGEVQVNRQLQLLDQNTVVQTGPGIPNWSWREHDIYFDSPVESGRAITITLIEPIWLRTLSASRALLLLTFLLFFLTRLRRLDWRQLRGEHSNESLSSHKAGATLLVFTLITLGGMISASAQESYPVQDPVQEQQQVVDDVNNTLNEGVKVNENSNTTLNHQVNLNQTASLRHKRQDSSVKAKDKSLLSLQPTAELMKEWRERMVAQNRCHGECIYLGDMNLSLKDRLIELTVMVHAERDSFVILPGTINDVQWKVVTVKESSLPLRVEIGKGDTSGGYITARVPRGVHLLKAWGSVLEVNSFDLAIHDLPKRLEVSLEGWAEENVRRGKVSPLLTFTREATVKAKAKRERDSRVNVDYSWFEVSRSLNLGPTWQVVTQVTRLSTDSVEEVILPRIINERVLSSELEVSPQGVRVTFDKGQRTVGYLSEMSPVAQLTLTAPDKVRWSERWTLNCGVIWSCETSGLNPVSLGGDSQASLTWRPWPQESVSVTVNRPISVVGAEVTANSVIYEFTPGDHLAKGSVTLSLNASRGGSRSLTLPDGAQLR